MADWFEQRREAFIEFRDKHPRVHCRKCRKRVSIDMDSVDLLADPVIFQCPHCHARFDVAK